MALSPEERSRVADVLYGADEEDRDAVAAAWGSVAAQRSDELESGAVRALTREEADAYLEARTVTRDT